MMSVD